jgi:hypothetical protein
VDVLEIFKDWAYYAAKIYGKKVNRFIVILKHSGTFFCSLTYEL